MKKKHFWSKTYKLTNPNSCETFHDKVKVLFTLMILLLRVRQASLLLRSVLAMVVVMLIAARMQEPSASFSQPTSTSVSIPDYKTATPVNASPHFRVSVAMTHLSEVDNVFVHAASGCTHYTSKVIHVHFQHLGVGQPQGHQTSQLGGPRRHLTGPLVGIVVEVIAAVQVGAVVRVALCLLFRKHHAYKI